GGQRIIEPRDRAGGRARRRGRGRSRRLRRRRSGGRRGRGRRRDVVHVDRNRAGTGHVAGGIAGDGGERVRAVRERGGVERRRERRARVLGAEVGTVEFELHRGHGDVVGGVGGDGDAAAGNGAVRGRR